MCIGVDGPNHGGFAQWTWKPFHEHNLSGIEVAFCSTSGQKKSINVEEKKAGFVENYENRTGGMAVQCAVMWRDRTRRNSAKICDNPKKIRCASKSCRKMTCGFSQRKKCCDFFFRGCGKSAKIRFWTTPPKTKSCNKISLENTSKKSENPISAPFAGI